MKKLIAVMFLSLILLLPIGAYAKSDSIKTNIIDGQKIETVWYEYKWVEINGNKYLIDKGEIVKGWRFDRDRTNDKYGDLIRPLSKPYWYYFDGNGKMLTNVIVDGYIIGADGKSYTDLDHNDKTRGQERTFAKTIIPITAGWKQINNKWYYFNQDLSLLTNGITPDGYKVNENGIWIQ